MHTWRMRKMIPQVSAAALLAAVPLSDALAQLPTQLSIAQQIHADFARERLLQIKGNSRL